MTPPAASALRGVRAYVVPETVLEATLEELRAAGTDGNEAFVLWGGRISDNGATVTFTSAMRPAQTASKTDDGLLVVVHGAALFAVNKRLFERGELLAGQVHSHPTDAYHSSTDDHFPLVTLVGALSLVIPDFARDGRRNRDRWAWYRLEAAGVWAPVDPAREIVFT